MRNKPSVQARCPEYQKLLKQKQVGPIGLAVALRFVNQFVFHEQSKPCYSARLQWRAVASLGLPLSTTARIPNF